VEELKQLAFVLEYSPYLFLSHGKECEFRETRSLARAPLSHWDIHRCVVNFVVPMQMHLRGSCMQLYKLVQLFVVIYISTTQIKYRDIVAWLWSLEMKFYYVPGSSNASHRKKLNVIIVKLAEP
jgi:hypothetical protein